MIDIEKLAKNLRVSEDKALDIFFSVVDAMSQEEAFTDFTMEEARQYKSPLVGSDRYILWAQSSMWAMYEELKNAVANRPG